LDHPLCELHAERAYFLIGAVPAVFELEWPAVADGAAHVGAAQVGVGAAHVGVGAAQVGAAHVGTGAGQQICTGTCRQTQRGTQRVWQY
jgi:hypothetical protein